MAEQKVQISEIDDIVPITFIPRDPLGVPIKADESNEAQGIVIDDIDKESSLKENEDNDQKTDPPTEEVEDGAGESRTELKVVEEQEPTTSAANDVLKDQLKKMYGEDFTVSIEVDGEEVEMSIEDMDIDPETFAQIITAQKEQEKEEALKDKIPTSKLSPFTRKLIEVEESGGSIRELLEYKESYLDPLEGIDFETPEGQKQSLALYYELVGQKSEEEVAILIEGYEKRGVLEERSLSAKEAIEKAIEAKAEAAKAEAIKAEQTRQGMVEEYRKTLKTTAKTKFGYNDTALKRFVDSATKVNEKTKRTPVVDNFQAMMANPDDAVDLILFLTNKEDYIKQITKEATIADKLKTAQKIGVVKLGSNVEVRKQQKSDEDSIVPITIVNK